MGDVNGSRSGPAPGTWRPANDAETLMIDALARNNSMDYFRVVASVPLYLPIFLSDAGTGRRRAIVKTINGERHLLVFTSVPGLTQYVEAGYTADSRPDGYATTSYSELAARRPEPEWRLAINPGQPIDAYVDIDAVMHAALGNIDVPLADEAMDPSIGATRAAVPGDFAAANMAERSIEAALTRRDTDTAIDALVVSEVLVPTIVPPKADQKLDGSFPWRLEVMDELPTITVFTSRERLAEALPADTSTYQTGFTQLALAWPNPNYQLVVNPNSDIELAFDGSVVPGFVSWAADLISRVESGQYQDPVAEGSDRAELATAAGTAAVLGAHAVNTSAAPPTGAVTPTSGAIMLQKVVPHDQVDLYLRRNQHRVAGFVHPYESVRHLTTPEKLYEGLGLVHERTAFRADDETVCVIRWYSYCAELYRAAIGGQDEGARAAVGGWVVEPAPFLGGGIAPGSAAAPEFKVDSIELPHGAQMYRIDRYGRQTEVASYDADLQLWAAAVGAQTRMVADG